MEKVEVEVKVEGEKVLEIERFVWMLNRQRDIRVGLRIYSMLSRDYLVTYP